MSSEKEGCMRISAADVEAINEMWFPLLTLWVPILLLTVSFGVPFAISYEL